MKIFLFIISAFIFGNCAFNNENYNQITIDEAIEKKVECEISDTVQIEPKQCGLDYLNNLHLEFYSNDTLQKNNFSKPNKEFYSTWGIKGDTAEIYGAFGANNSGHFGFDINLIKGVPKVTFCIRPHLGGSNSYTKDGKIEFNMDIPTKKSKIILSKMPDNQRTKIIYGYIEFETTEFYYATKYEDGKEVPNQRDKVRCNMKIYFKANKCDSLLYE